MNWIDGILLTAGLLGASLVTGCLQGRGEQERARGEAITLSRGPCFGFCPVYQVSVSPGGRVDFEGIRHTSVIGPRSRSAGKDAYRKVRHSLAELRPETGTSHEFPCPAGHTDTSLLTFEWVSPHGQRTIFRYRMGCPSPHGVRIEKLLAEQLGILQVTEWTRPVM